MDVVPDDFDTLHRMMQSRIDRWSWQSVPGMTREEVAVEITECLWKAWQRYDPDHPVGFYRFWQAVWMNHKGHLIEKFFRIKRQSEVLTDGDTIVTLAKSYSIELFPDCPVEDEDTRRVWDLLGQGLRLGEVQKALGISRRRFDQLIATLRTPEVVAILTT